MGNILKSKIDKILEAKKLSRRKLAKLIDKYEGNVNAMIIGTRPFTETVLKKILPILEISNDEINSWIIADKYSKEILELAIKKKSNKKGNKLILTTQIDAILQAKNMSRTALAKQIKYSQSGLNRMIIGKIPMSKSIIERISPVLEVSKETINSWIIADRYSLQRLKLALKIFE